MKNIKKIIKSRFHIPLYFAIFIGLLFSRRWDQIVSPQVWSEDGTKIIYGFMTHGWHTFFEPVNGYLITVPKIISMISLLVSFLHYPIVSTILSAIFIALVGLAITISPTKINGKFFCAVAVFIIPSDPEVFLLPLYTFWWASLLLFLVAIWDEKNASFGWRLCFLLLGGLSSPVILLVLPIFYLRIFLYRSWRFEYVLALIATLIGIIQINFLVADSAGEIPPINSILMNVITTFFGNFLVGNWTNNNILLWAAGVGLVVIIIAWFIQARDNVTARILLFLLAGSIGLSVARVDPAIMHPMLLGPRYFFFPFILMFWILIQYLYADHGKWFRGFIRIVTMAVLINSVPAWSRQHDDLQWADHVRSCRLFPEYSIPIQTYGVRSSVWFLKLPGKSCYEFFERDSHVSKKELQAHPTFAYSVFNEKRTGNKEKVGLIRSTMTGSDFQKPKLDGYHVIGSFNTSDADTGEVLLRVRRGDHILYRSGPVDGGQSMSIDGYEKEFIQSLPSANDWVVLEFSNANLPAEFILKIKDEGKGFGEWSAIAIGN